ncbi:MAG: calcium/sodium antiporter [Deltaproteobacteria bacterium]|nr:calcium/sodium antiporter [Deltaproteobacteria bacterium]
MAITGLLILGLALLYFGAEWLVRGSSKLALRFKVPSLVIGLTIVAFGTSTPELVVSLKAGLDGLGDISVGNVVGSNIFNIAVILGLSALVRPLRVHLKVLRIDTSIMIGVSVLLCVLLQDNFIDRSEGLVLFVGITLYTLFTIYIGKKYGQMYGSAASEALQVRVVGSVTSDILTIILGLACLVIGSRCFVEGAVALASALGVSQAVIGLTIVAAGTSFPELATSIVAAGRKEEDIAIGNIIGSNIFNILAILGLSAMIAPLRSDGIGRMDLAFMMTTAVLLFPFMWTKYELNRIEATVFLLIYAVYVYLLWPK